jgi:hypothetical protein
MGSGNLLTVNKSVNTWQTTWTPDREFRKLPNRTNNRRSAIIWEIGGKSELMLDSMMAQS